MSQMFCLIIIYLVFREILEYIFAAEYCTFDIFISPQGSKSHLELILHAVVRLDVNGVYLNYC